MSTMDARGIRRFGSSGASVTLLDQYALKRGDRRVGEQGRFLDQLGCSYVPMTHLVGETFYIMERLYPDSSGHLANDFHGKLHDTVVTLQSFHGEGRDVPLVELNVNDHARKMTDLFERLALSDELRRSMLDGMLAIDWSSLRAVKTHGDPTVDNTMYDTRGRTVLTDPLPATTAVPDLECVDYGKVGQSALGYEGVRWNREKVVSHAFLEEHMGDDTNEHRARRYWTAYHLLRALPYMPKDKRDDIGKLFTTAVARIRP